MKCAVQIYMLLGGFHVYRAVVLGWVAGRFNIAVNGEHNCGVPPIYIVVSKVNVGTKNVLLTTILYFQIHNK